MKRAMLLAVLAVTMLAAKTPSGLYTPIIGYTTTSGGTILIGGCGFNAGYGDVTVALTTPFDMQSRVRAVDADGCILVDDFLATGPGHYVAQAHQRVTRKDRVVAETRFDLE